MTARPSPEHRSSPSIDEELIERTLRYRRDNLPERTIGYKLFGELTDRLESLLSDRAKLEERVRELEATLKDTKEQLWRVTKDRLKIQQLNRSAP
jgi:flagellar motility protein MotE (MotC chaperone)